MLGILVLTRSFVLGILVLMRSFCVGYFSINEMFCVGYFSINEKFCELNRLSKICLKIVKTKKVCFFVDIIYVRPGNTISILPL